MESFKNPCLLRYFFVLASTGLASGDGLDDLLDNDDHLLYLAIGFLCFSVLFLFAVILMLSVVAIRVKKLLKVRQTRDYYHRDSETVIANTYNIPLSERRMTDPPGWNQYFPEIRNSGELTSATNVDYLDYMDLIIMDANKVSLPRAKVEIGEKAL